MSTVILPASKSPVAGRPGRPPLLPLRNGEHLSRAEFERRWEATPGLKRAELIEGIVFMSPPISEQHSSAHTLLFRLLDEYAAATPGVRALINPSLRLDLRNKFQPDCVLRIDHSTLGRSRVAADGLLEGAPELVAEIAVSSTDYEAHEKRAVYEPQGIQEYLLWQVLDARCDWWTLQDGVYTPLAVRADGVVRSQVFPGLWLDRQALLAGDERRLATVLARGLRSAEHAAFARRLTRK